MKSFRGNFGKNANVSFYMFHVSYATNYSRMDQVKFVEDKLEGVRLKAVFHKFYLVHS